MSMTNGRRERVGRVGTHGAANAQERTDHPLHLLLGCAAVADYGHLDFGRRIFRHPETMLGCRQQCDAARLSKLQRALGVAREKHLLETHSRRLLTLDDFPQSAIDQAQALGQAGIWGNRDDTMAVIHKPG